MKKYFQKNFIIINYVMNQLLKIIGLIVVLNIGTIANGADSVYWLCKLNKIVRTVQVKADTGGRCKALYTKENIEKEIASSKDSQLCLNITTDLIKNLEKGGWSCRDVSQSGVSEAPSVINNSTDNKIIKE